MPVNIVYPISGAHYPIVDPAPAPPVHSAYFTSSFGVTCAGGSHSVKWGFDGAALGSATFYDEISVQFTHKLPGGGHDFFVDAGPCGRADVKFFIG
jgi:hypothetical protein